MASNSFSGAGTYTWDVPDGVSTIQIAVNGAGGGGGDGDSQGGHGARVVCEYSVSPGDTVEMDIGGQGGSTFDDNGAPGGENGPGGAGGDGLNGGGAGGGGGGWTAVYLNGTLVAVAGGGGGGNGYKGGLGGPDDGEPGIATQSGSALEAGGDGESTSNGDGAGGGGGAGYGGGAGGRADTGQGGEGGMSLTTGTVIEEVDGGGNHGDGSVTTSYEEPPAAPNRVTQTVEGDDQIAVDATADTSRGGTDNYRIEVSEDGGAYSLAAEPNSMPYTYAADTAVDTHQFRVRAENSVGASDWVTTTSKSTDITSVTASNVTGTSFDLSWDAAADATEYDVLLAEASGSTEADYAVDQTVSGTEATIEGLENGERYFARAVARYPQADSLSEVEAATTTDLPAPVLNYLDRSVGREVTADYELPDNSSDGDVLVERSVDGGQTWTTAGTVSDLSLTAFTDTGRLDGEEYTYRLTRQTDHAASTSGALAAVTKLPAPTDLQLVSVNGDQFELGWTDNSNNETGARVSVSRDDGDTWTDDSGDLPPDTETYTTTNLLDGEQYTITVEVFTEHAARRESAGFIANTSIPYGGGEPYFGGYGG